MSTSWLGARAWVACCAVLVLTAAGCGNSQTTSPNFVTDGGGEPASDVAGLDVSAADLGAGDAAPGDVAPADVALNDVPQGDGAPGLDGSASDGEQVDSLSPDVTQTDAVDPGADGAEADAVDSVAADAAQTDTGPADSGPADTGPADSGPADAGPTDTSTADAAGDGSSAADSGGDAGAGSSLAAPCDSDDDCLGTGTGKKCDMALHACAMCLSSKDCASGELCQNHTCHPSKVCKSDTDCKSTAQVCDKAEGVCVDCASDLDCTAGKCVDHACIPAKACKSSKDCPAVCDQALGLCVECKDSVDCAVGKACYAGFCKPVVCAGPLCAGGKSFVCKPDGSAYLAGQGCDDKNACTDGDACTDGLCKPGPTKLCNDGNPCTADSCDVSLGCQYKAAPAACDDNNKCTDNDQCGGGLCAGTPKNCDDGQLCTADSCKDGNCVLLAVDATCTDGSACTLGDVCAAGKCKPGPTLVCDDGNACTKDVCDPIKGCTFTATDGATCDDGNNCTTGDKCVADKCTGVGKQCDDGNVCTDDKCDGGNCNFVANTKPCSDGNACTGGDICAAGKCTGAKDACDDSNVCTTDVCLSVGCQHNPNSLACDDGNACTDKDVCAFSQCAGTAKACDDGNECTSDSCSAGTCVYQAVDGPCGGPGSCAVCKLGKCAADAVAGFEETYGGLATDKFSASTVTPDGGLLVVGTTASKGAGSDDGWLVKLDNKGNLLWEKTFGGGGSDSFADIQPIGNGNYGIVGTNSSGANGAQLWYLVVDGNGTLAPGLEKTFGSYYADYGRALSANAAGFLVAAQKQVWDGKNYIYYGWILQLDFNGNKQWEKDLTNITDAVGIAAVEDQSVVVGHGYNAATSGQDIYVQRLKSGGAQVWQATIGATGSDSAVSVKLLKDGTLLVTGRLGYYFTDPSVIVRYDGTGGVLWKTTDATLTGDLTEAAQLGSNLIFSGHVRANSQWDGRVVSLSLADGKLQWAKTAVFSLSYDDMLMGIVPFGAGVALVGAAYVGGGAGVDGWLLALTDQGKIACQCDVKCDDGNPCTVDSCYLGTCKSKPSATGSFCLDSVATPGKCDAAQKCVSTCGNNYCDPGETTNNCAKDCKVVVAHPCDNYCGGSNSTYGCFCDAACKTYGDCCLASGAKGTSCAGSTCSLCK